MANYLPIYKNLWTSTKFNKLNSNEKLIFIYLISSPLSSNIGIFNILPRQIASDCGLDIDFVEKTIDKMSKIELLQYWKDENLIYIFNMFKFTRGTIKNPTILYKQVLRQEQLIQNHECWQIFKEQYSYFYEEVKEFEEKQNNSDNMEDSS